jgi:hypothetical protein
MTAHVGLQIVENQVQARIACRMDMDLIAGIPVDPERPGEQLGIHDPLAGMPIEIGFADLHGQGIDSAVGEQLDRFGYHDGHALAPAKHLLRLADRAIREGRNDRLPIRDEIEAEGTFRSG